ncbi:MAG: hypothetical protein JNK90_00335 [Planctomycetaceae bacterium]|nr:hypothetical protein [Planctomycetaceae bacterium]
MSNMNNQNPYSSDQPGGPPQYYQQGQYGQNPNEGDATGGVIPYKNPKALIAYYLGILSGLPVIGIPLVAAAFVLGVLGLRDRARNPVIKGSVHAAIGIGCGGFFFVLWTFLTIGVIVAMVANAR